MRHGVRYGYRRVDILLKREGWDVNLKRIYRIYKDLGLKLWNKHTEATGQNEAAGRSP